MAANLLRVAVILLALASIGTVAALRRAATACPAPLHEPR
jgi:hypothetical protein